MSLYADTARLDGRESVNIPMNRQIRGGGRCSFQIQASFRKFVFGLVRNALGSKKDVPALFTGNRDSHMLANITKKIGINLSLCKMPYSIGTSEGVMISPGNYSL